MSDISTFLRSVLTAGLLLASLGLVTWRQSRALEALARLDEARNQASVASAERIDLTRTIQWLESRARLVPVARDRLGMHTPDASEMQILPGAPTP